MAGARRSHLLRDYVHSFDPRLDDTCDDCEDEMPPTCGEEHGRVCERLGAVEKTQADHETRIRVTEAASGVVAGKFVWVLVTTFVTCAISAFVGLLIARAAGG